MVKKNETRYSLNVPKSKPHVKEFLDIQTKYSDAIFYLIEKEIYENGYRNLQKFIPSVRDEYFFQELLQHSPERVPVERPKHKAKISIAKHEEEEIEEEISINEQHEKLKIEEKKVNIPLEYLDD